LVNLFSVEDITQEAPTSKVGVSSPLTNPMTIMSFDAVFAGLGVGVSGSYSLAGVMVLGVFIGSMLWWLILCSVVNKLRAKFDQNRLKWVNKLSGFVIAGFGVLSLITI